MNTVSLLLLFLTACMPQWPGGEQACPTGSGVGLDGECHPIDTSSESFSSPDTGPMIWYQDADGDTYGDPDAAYPGETAPGGYVDNAQDCDDTNAAISPDQPELYGDELDNNCDGRIDEPESIVGSYTGEVTFTQNLDSSTSNTCSGSTSPRVYMQGEEVFLFGDYVCTDDNNEPFLQGHFFAAITGEEFSGTIVGLWDPQGGLCRNYGGSQSYSALPNHQALAGTVGEAASMAILTNAVSCLGNYAAEYDGQLTLSRDTVD